MKILDFGLAKLLEELQEPAPGEARKLATIDERAPRPRRPGARWGVCRAEDGWGCSPTGPEERQIGF